MVKGSLAERWEQYPVYKTFDVLNFNSEIGINLSI